MADIRNKSFEIPTYNLGEAAYWDEIYPFGGNNWCGFVAGSREVPFETFNSDWSNNENSVTYFVTGTVAFALFNYPTSLYYEYSAYYATEYYHAIETFNSGWKEPSTDPGTNDQSIFSFLDTSGAYTLAPFDGEDQEDFDESWASNENSCVAFTDVSGLAVATNATFDSGSPEAYEDFNEEWQDNEDYAIAFNSPTLVVPGTAGRSVAQFDGVSFETFETAWTETFI